MQGGVFFNQLRNLSEENIKNRVNQMKVRMDEKEKEKKALKEEKSKEVVAPAPAPAAKKQKPKKEEAKKAEVPEPVVESSDIQLDIVDWDELNV